MLQTGDAHCARRRAARAQLPRQLRGGPHSAHRHHFQPELPLAHRARRQRRVAHVLLRVGCRQRNAGETDVDFTLDALRIGNRAARARRIFQERERSVKVDLLGSAITKIEVDRNSHKRPAVFTNQPALYNPS